MWWKISTGSLMDSDSVKCMVEADSFDEALAIGRMEYGQQINGGQPYDETRETDKILFQQARKIRGKDYRRKASSK